MYILRIRNVIFKFIITRFLNGNSAIYIHIYAPRLDVILRYFYYNFYSISLNVCKNFLEKNFSIILLLNE